MDKQTTDQTTFHLVQKGKDPQTFTDAKQAGAAWFKVGLAGAAAGKPGDALTVSKPMDMPAIQNAQRGMTYDGKIFGFVHNHVIQAVSDGQKTIHIAHERAALQGKSSLLSQGKELSIRYS